MAIRERYSHAIADKHKVGKRKEAEARAAVRAGRSDEQQLQRLADGGYGAGKEKKRLRERIKCSRSVKKT